MINILKKLRKSKANEKLEKFFAKNRGIKIFVFVLIVFCLMLRQLRYDYIDLDKVELGKQIYLTCPHNVKIERIIDIVLASDNNFAPHCATTMCSALLNSDATSYFRFHILDGGITEENKSKIRQLKSLRPFDISFYEMKKYDWYQFPINWSWISHATYYRLVINEVLPKHIEKVLYLDCDLIIEQDLKNLWDIDISDVILAGVEDNLSISKANKLKIHGKYCNAGVLLLNLKRLRNIDLKMLGIKFLEEKDSDIYYQDQDIINGLLGNDCRYVPIKWNVLSDIYFSYSEENFYDREDALNAIKSPAIIHFTGPHKPWSLRCFHPLQGEYQKYFAYTTFKNPIFDWRTFRGFVRRIRMTLHGFR